MFSQMNEPQQPAEIPLTRHLGMDHEDRIDREEGPQQGTVEKGLVIGDDQRALVFEHIRIAAHPHAKQRPQNDAQEEFHHRRTVEPRFHADLPKDTVLLASRKDRPRWLLAPPKRLESRQIGQKVS